MPFTTTEIQNAGYIGLDFYVRNNPIDQIAVERPLLKKLMEKSKTFPGAKQFIVEQLRYRYQSNFQWYYGAQSVTYNTRNTINQASFPWRGWHDGFFLDEDRLLQNGIILDDAQSPRSASKAERIQLTNLIEEESEVLRLGAEEKFDYELHLDGTQNAEALEGLDKLVSTTPATGTVGGIDASANVYWRNNADLTIDSSNILDNMEIGYRACVRNGGAIDCIQAGEDFIDTYRAAIRAAGEYQLNPQGGQVFDGGLNGDDPTDTGLRFKGIKIVWDPVFADLDAAGPPAVPWQSRCYFLNTRHLRLRPAEGHNMITRKPPREYNKYVFYWALTWKGALCTNRRNAHMVFALA